MAGYNFVKFIRGTQTAFSNLRTKDPNTLYFVYQNADSTYGSLYLGDKLISGGEVASVVSLSDLSDIELADVVANQILVYDAESEKWKNLDLAQALQNAGINPGNSVTQVEPNAGESDAEAIDRVIPDPNEGDVAFVGDNVYIYNGDSWQQISDGNLQEQIDAIKETIGEPGDNENPATGLYQVINNAIANVNHLSYKKIASLDDIILDAENADRYVYLVNQSVGSLNDIYDEYLVIDGALEKIGQWNVGQLADLEAAVSDLTNIVKGVAADGDNPAIPGLVERVIKLENAVGDISQLYNYDAENPVNIINTINEINERLVWHDMDEDGNTDYSDSDVVIPEPDADITPIPPAGN